MLYHPFGWAKASWKSLSLQLGKRYRRYNEGFRHLVRCRNVAILTSKDAARGCKAKSPKHFVNISGLEFRLIDVMFEQSESLLIGILHMQFEAECCEDV